MLQQFSWGHFLIAMVVLNLVWYLFVALVFYRAEVMALGGGGSANAAGSGNPGWASSSGNGVNISEEEIEREVDAALMGTSRLPEGVEVKRSAQVSFSASDGDGRYDQVGLVADVVQELKLIFSELESSGGGKVEFFRKVELLKEDFGGIGGHPSLSAINGFIRERALFPISDTELADLWY